jgi:AcrR family transcriptional regulator
VTAFLSLLQQKIILSGIHEKFRTSFRALHVLLQQSDLFKQYGFHKVGVDRIISEAKIPATFYNYFHSKERLIEMCLYFKKTH